jgi:hypothetical protein
VHTSLRISSQLSSSWRRVRWMVEAKYEKLYRPFRRNRANANATLPSHLRILRCSMLFENVLRRYVSRGMVCRNQRREEDTRPIWKSDFLTGLFRPCPPKGVQWLWLILVDTHRLRSDQLLTRIVNVWLVHCCLNWTCH